VKPENVSYEHWNLSGLTVIMHMDTEHPGHGDSNGTPTDQARAEHRKQHRLQPTQQGEQE
jgi:hypothetical protein